MWSDPRSLSPPRPKEQPFGMPRTGLGGGVLHPVGSVSVGCCPKMGEGVGDPATGSPTEGPKARSLCKCVTVADAACTRTGEGTDGGAGGRGRVAPGFSRAALILARINVSQGHVPSALPRVGRSRGGALLGDLGARSVAGSRAERPQKGRDVPRINPVQGPLAERKADRPANWISLGLAVSALVAGLAVVGCADRRLSASAEYAEGRPLGAASVREYESGRVVDPAARRRELERNSCDVGRSDIRRTVVNVRAGSQTIRKETTETASCL